MERTIEENTMGRLERLKCACEEKSLMTIQYNEKANNLQKAIEKQQLNSLAINLNPKKISLAKLQQSIGK